MDSTTITITNTDFKSDRKVYCENCKFLKDNRNRFNLRPVKFFCYTPENLIRIDTPMNYWYRGEKEPQYLNASNNCSYYKRKWWKFWIKED